MKIEDRGRAGNVRKKGKTKGEDKEREMSDGKRRKVNGKAMEELRQVE